MGEGVNKPSEMSSMEGFNRPMKGVNHRRNDKSLENGANQPSEISNMDSFKHWGGSTTGGIDHWMGLTNHRKCQPWMGQSNHRRGQPWGVCTMGHGKINHRIYQLWNASTTGENNHVMGIPLEGVNRPHIPTLGYWMGQPCNAAGNDRLGEK